MGKQTARTKGPWSLFVLVKGLFDHTTVADFSSLRVYRKRAHHATTRSCVLREDDNSCAMTDRRSEQGKCEEVERLWNVR